MKQITLLLISVFACSISGVSLAAETQFSTARDYNFSMAGALINQSCEATWEQGNDISINACRYRLAQLYNFAVASAHFEECSVAAAGDIVKIAECMTERFQAWIKLESP